MVCNLNFNECNLGGNYPTPIYTCCNLLTRIFLAQTSQNVIINPILLTL